MSYFRTRWAAIGAAVAIALGAGGIGLVSATNPASALTFVSITPCRVIDTRPAPDTVGPKSSPLGGGEIHTVATHGTNGKCTGIPATALAVSLNVTAVGATLPTFLTVWAAGAPQPEASSLNPVPGSAPTPNAVTTALNGAGQFSIFNLQGSVNVLADINGYYVDHDHDDRYYTKSDIDAALTAGKWISIDVPSVNKRNGATFVRGSDINAGIVMPDASSASIDFGFSVPPDYTASTSILVEVLWHIAQTGCTVNLSWEHAGGSRRGISSYVPGIAAPLSDPVPATSNQVARTTFELGWNANGLTAGDAILMGIIRSSSSDTCTQDVKIKGIRVVYT